MKSAAYKLLITGVLFAPGALGIVGAKPEWRPVIIVAYAASWLVMVMWARERE